MSSEAAARSMPPFDEVQKLLAAVDADVSAAEAHGSLCGALAAPRGNDDGWQKGWLERVLGAALMNRSDAVSHCTRSLLALFAVTQTMLADDELSFQPLMPDDNAELPERAAALSQWCDGFVFGLALAEGSPAAPDVVANASGKALPASIQPAMSKETSEVVEDFIEISRVAQDAERSGDSGTEEDDAYHELLEYVRVATMLLYTEKGRLAAAANKNSGKDSSAPLNKIGPAADETIH